jgi:hypothetical protein
MRWCASRVAYLARLTSQLMLATWYSLPVLCSFVRDQLMPPARSTHSSCFLLAAPCHCLLPLATYRYATIVRQNSRFDAESLAAGPPAVSASVSWSLLKGLSMTKLLRSKKGSGASAGVEPERCVSWSRTRALH